MSFFPTIAERYERCAAAYSGSCKCRDRGDGPCINGPGVTHPTTHRYVPNPSALERRIVALYQEADKHSGKKAARIRRDARGLQARSC